MRYGRWMAAAYQSVSILDRSLVAVAHMSNITGGFAFDPVRDLFYGVDPATDQVIAYDTNTWQERYRLDIGENVIALMWKITPKPRSGS